MSDTVLIMAAGTGGHVFPALAVAQYLQAHGVRVEWLGTRKGLESTVVTQASIPLHTISITGVRGRGLLRLLKAPFQLCVAICQSLKIIKKVKPICVLGMGGFVAGPGGVAARLTQTPLVIHEQNAIPGLTNSILAKFAQRVLQAFPCAFISADEKFLVTGNPLRQNILNVPMPQQRPCHVSSPLKVLVVGGSLGAAAINELIPRTLALIPESERPQVKHQTGTSHLAITQKQYQLLNVQAEVLPFIENMAEVYGWADLVICRSGALTVSEISAVGIASILIPFPHAVDDHQTANAMFLVRNNAAILMQQRDLSADELARLLVAFNKERARLQQMAIAARQLAMPQATQTVAEQCLEVARDAA